MIFRLRPLTAPASTTLPELPIHSRRKLRTQVAGTNLRNVQLGIGVYRYIGWRASRRFESRRATTKYHPWIPHIPMRKPPSLPSSRRMINLPKCLGLPVKSKNASSDPADRLPLSLPPPSQLGLPFVQSAVPFHPTSQTRHPAHPLYRLHL